MDPTSIAAISLDLQRAAESLTKMSKDFSLAVRIAFRDVVTVRKELGSLLEVLKMLQEEMEGDLARDIPDGVLGQLSIAMTSCNTIFGQISAVLEGYLQEDSTNSPGWVEFGRQEIERLLLDLNGHRVALDWGLQMVAL